MSHRALLEKTLADWPAHPRADLLRAALAGGETHSLPAAVWDAAVKASRDFGQWAVKPDDIEAALGGGLTSKGTEILALTLEQAAVIGRAVVYELDRRGVRGADGSQVSKGRVEPMRSLVSLYDDGTAGRGKGSRRKFLGCREEPGAAALTFRGGHLGRCVARVQAGHDASPLAWAVTLWRALAPAETVAAIWPAVEAAALLAEQPAAVARAARVEPPDRTTIREPVIVRTVVDLDGEAVPVVAWGSWSAAEVRRMDRSLQDEPLLHGVVEDEVSTEALAAWMAEAERLRDLEKIRLPGEVADLEAARDKLVEAWQQARNGALTISGLKLLGRPDEGAALTERRAKLWAADLVRMRADDPRLGRARDRVRLLVNRSDRRSKAPAGATLWTQAIREHAEALHRETAAERESAMWAGWPSMTPVGRAKEQAGRKAAAMLLALPCPAPVALDDAAEGAWRRAALRRVAEAGLLRAMARAEGETVEGRRALGEVWRSLGLSFRSTAEDKRTTSPDHEADERTARLGLRVAVDEAAGLQVLRRNTDADARRELLGPEVAAILGRGEVAVLGSAPPRVIIGTVAELAAAGYERLTSHGGGVVEVAARSRWVDEVGVPDSVFERGVRMTTAALRAGADVPSLAAVAVTVRPPCEVEFSKTKTSVMSASPWQPALAPEVDATSGIAPALPFEWCASPIVVGDGSASATVGESLSLRFGWVLADDAEPLRVEVTIRRAESRGNYEGEESATLRAWRALHDTDVGFAGHDVSLGDHSIVTESILDAALALEGHLAVLRSKRVRGKTPAATTDCSTLSESDDLDSEEPDDEDEPGDGQDEDDGPQNSAPQQSAHL